MIIDFKKFIDKSYLFDVSPPPDFALRKTLIIIFGLQIFVAIFFLILGFFKKKNRIWHDLRNRFFWWFFTCGFIGFMLLLFRYQQIPLLSSRFLILILSFIFIIWGIYLFYWIIFIYRKRLTYYHDFTRKVRYLPRKKKK